MKAACRRRKNPDIIEMAFAGRRTEPPVALDASLWNDDGIIEIIK